MNWRRALGGFGLILSVAVGCSHEDPSTIPGGAGGSAEGGGGGGGEPCGEAGCSACNNGQIDPGEACDGTQVGAESCVSQGFPNGGALVCNATCDDFDTSGCAPNAVLEIALGASHSCGRFDNATVVCWGFNTHGELGRETTETCSESQCSSTPAAVTGLLGATGMAAGPYHSCAVSDAGTVHCWGDNTDDQLGYATTTTCAGDRACSRTASAVSGLANAAAVSVGGWHTCVRLDDRTVACWGNNAFGQLGDDSTNGSAVPVAAPGLVDVAEVVLGYDHSCALLTDNTVQCWGRNSDGQLGYSSSQDCSGYACNPTPAAVPGLSGVIQLSLAAGHGCALIDNGTIECWGGNFSGELGYPTTTECSRDGGSYACSLTPTTVPGLSGVEQVSVAGYHSCARLTDGTVKCWGSNTSGQLGYPTTETCSTLPCSGVPTTVPGLSDVVEIAAGWGHTCARLAAGTVVCWGDNAVGQLGDGTTTNRTTPAAVNW